VLGVIVVFQLFALTAMDVFAQAAGTLPPPLFATDQTQAIPIPSAFGDRVLIQGAINGQMFWFHLDTGTTGLALSREAAHRAALRLDVDAHQLTADLDVGPLHAKDARFTVLDGYSVDDAGHHVDGIIGAPFFRSNIVTIDFPARSVTVYPRGYPPPVSGIATPLLIRGYSAAVQVGWGGALSTLYLDTGSDRTILFAPFARAVRRGPIVSMYSASIGVGSPTTDLEEVHALPMHLAALTVRDPVILVAAEPPAWLRGQPYDGILGRDALRLFKVTLDYVEGIAYWR
jgi:hypothetical protein